MIGELISIGALVIFDGSIPMIKPAFFKIFFDVDSSTFFRLLLIQSIKNYFLVVS